jgi:hypothetical protein
MGYKLYNQTFQEVIQCWKGNGNENVDVESFKNVDQSLTRLICISYHIILFFHIDYAP